MPQPPQFHVLVWKSGHAVPVRQDGLPVSRHMHTPSLQYWLSSKRPQNSEQVVFWRGWKTAPEAPAAGVLGCSCVEDEGHLREGGGEWGRTQSSEGHDRVQQHVGKASGHEMRVVVEIREKGEWEG